MEFRKYKTMNINCKTMNINCVKISENTNN
jgi:hypothetical protein